MQKVLFFVSPIEFCVLGKNEADYTVINTAIVKGIKSKIIHAADSAVEWKNLSIRSVNYLISGYNGEPYRVWPDRIFDSLMLEGNEHLVIDACKRIHEEWKSNSVIRERLRKNLKMYLLTNRTGTNNYKTHFDSSTGEIFFDKQQYIRGLKYGPIRLVQGILTLHQLENGIINTDTRTIVKLREQYPLDSEVRLAYQHALLIYHAQQEHFSKNGNGHMIINPHVLSKITQTIDHFATRELRSMTNLSI